MVTEGTPTRVQLHLYDLSQGMARAMSAQLLGKQLDGIWHTGIVAYGQEFYFGGGIQCGTPGCTHFGRPLQVIDLGETHIPRELFDEFLVDVAPRFTMHTYNLLRHNCNNFSDEIANFLVGEGIPRHILDLPDEVMSTPLGQQLMPMLSMMDAQMRTVSEGGGGQFGAWTPPTNVAAAPASRRNERFRRLPRRPPAAAAVAAVGGSRERARARARGARARARGRTSSSAARRGARGGVRGCGQGGVRQVGGAGRVSQRRGGGGGSRRATDGAKVDAIDQPTIASTMYL